METQGPAPSSQLINEPPKQGAIERVDWTAFRAIYFGTRNPVFNVLMPAMSLIANRGALHIIAGGALILAGISIKGGERLYQAGVIMLAAAGVAGVLAECTIKLVWKRKRPFQVVPGVRALVPSKRLSHRPSFPSGHSAGYMAAATAVSIFFPQFAPILIIFGLLGAYSRIYNGVHFPSDVIVGITVGVGSAFAVAAAASVFVKF